MHLSTQINFWILCGLVSAWPNPIIEIEADNSTITNTLVSRDVSSAIIWDTKGDTSVGGCSGYVDKINKAYDEAVLMASEASTAVKALKGKVPPAGSTGSQFNDRVKWLKYQKLVDKLFGIQVQADVDTQPGDVPRKLDQLVAVFDSISGPADTTSNPPPAKAQDKKRLFCGDGNWLYIDPKGEYKDLLTDKYPNGAWLIRGTGAEVTNPADKIAPVLWPASLSPERAAAGRKISDNTCSTAGNVHIQGRTISQRNLFLICPDALNNAATVSEFASHITKDTTMDDVNIDKAISRVMFHEFVHLYQGVKDEKAILFDGTGPVLGSDGKTPQRSSTVCYNWPRVWQLAIYAPDSALTNPDSFTMFALAVHLNEWLWFGSQGKATLKLGFQST